MKLKAKTLLIVFFTLALLVGALHLVFTRVLLTGFERLEDDAVITDTFRAADALSEKLNGLATKSGDWSAWDDTYEFVQDLNPRYVESNLNPESIQTLKIDLMLFYNVKMSLRYSGAKGGNGSEVNPVESEISNFFTNNKALLTHANAESVHSGFARFGTKLLMFASRPIVDSKKTAAQRGSLVFGQWADPSLFRQLSEVTHLKVDFYHYPPVPVEPVARDAYKALEAGTSIYRRALSEHEISGSTYIRDALGNPCGILTVTTNRDIYRQGKITYKSVLASACLMALIFGLVTILLLEYSVLSRLMSLVSQVQDIERSHNPSERLNVSGKDEISDLASHINNMLQSLSTFQKQLQREEALARSASAAKSLFVANISHELRTPLNGILGMTHLLQDTSLTVQQEEYTEVIGSSSEFLLEIINDLLDFSKIEAGKLSLDPAPFELSEALQSTVRLLSHLATERRLDLALNIDERIPDVLVGDRARICQVIINLIGNALKFTTRGSISLDVTLKKVDQQFCSIDISIQDTGIGIPRDKLDSIFDEFTQVDQSATRHHGGTGLGLAICRHLVRLMGSDLKVDSTVGVGSRFWFTVDLPQAGPNSRPVKRFSSRDNQRIQKASVLVVEDNLVNQKVAVGMLKKLGCTVDVAENGEEALTKVKEHAYHVVFMDCQMPVMDGYEATRKIREWCKQTGSPRYVPIIALTANSVEEERRKCLAAGMDDFMSKPAELDTLREKILDWILRPIISKPSGAVLDSRNDSL